ncbi:hypothetical protein L2D08_11490 [Domibacillus sp. PGB-M46]|uniref:hypothetical protein n=1 Tax=Domibacillus sp. PGB-M46 TaxID=2910255 RepID=UPI001F5AD249|nr:hypothetical protein [Domibacillus sp. PGB-M46]MCI2254987.1 hypothetical protein [Domibacillus sp. PGB-M46]
MDVLLDFGKIMLMTMHMNGMIGGVQAAPLSMGQALSPASPGGSIGLNCPLVP